MERPSGRRLLSGLCCREDDLTPEGPGLALHRAVGRGGDPAPGPVIPTHIAPHPPPSTLNRPCCPSQPR